MRVVVVSRWYPSDDDPVGGIFVEDQVRTLREICDVRVLVPTSAPMREVVRFLLARGPLGTEQVVPTPATRLGFALRTSTLALARAFGRLGASPPDGTVVHVHVLLPDALPALVAARLRHWPVVVTEHINFLRELIRSRRARAQARATLRFADAVVPVGEALAEELRALEPRARLTPIPNALDVARFRPAAEPARDYIVNVAIALGEAKGTDVLLRAWAVARPSVPGSLRRLVLVGDGPDRAGAERLADELDVVSDCRFVGLVRRDELARLLQGAAFVVSASLDETFGLVVAEAIACGTPVVATRTGKVADTITDAVGLVTEPGDVDGLAAAVVEMSHRYREYDPARLHEHICDLYGGASVRDRLLELYRALLDRRGQRRARA